MTAATTRRDPFAPGHACGDACSYAASDVSTCVCICAGRNHGTWHYTPEQREAYIAALPARDAFARIPGADDEDEAF